MPMAGAVAPPPPVDGASDHPDQFVPEAVRNFLPIFYMKFKEKVRYDDVTQTCCPTPGDTANLGCCRLPLTGCP